MSLKELYKVIGDDKDKNTQPVPIFRLSVEIEKGFQNQIVTRPKDD